MRSLLIIIRGVITEVWSLISTFLYSMLCLIALIFSKRLAYAIGVMWCRHLLAFAGVSTKVIGLEKITPYEKYILVCNHQSNLDIPSLMKSLPLQLVFVAKKELFRMPFFGWGIKGLGHIAIDRSSPRKARYSFMKASEQLQKDNRLSLVIFPEGTRSPDGKLQEFKNGSFALPIDTGLPILPVAIKGTHDALPKGRQLAKPAQVTVIIGDVIDPSGYNRHDKDKLATATRAQIAAMTGQE